MITFRPISLKDFLKLYNSTFFKKMRMKISIAQSLLKDSRAYQFAIQALINSYILGYSKFVIGLAIVLFC